MLFALLCGATAWAQQEFNPSNPPDPRMLYKVVVSATDGHYTSGSGSYAKDTKVTINTSASGANFDFKYWTKNGAFYSTERRFTYTVEAMDVRFQAVYEFNPSSPQDPQTPNEYRLYLVPDPEDACSFSRTSGAKVEAGTIPTVTAYASQGFVFQGWYNGDEKISESETLTTFTMPKANTTLTAKFEFSPTLPGDPESSQTNVNQGNVIGDLTGDGKVSITDVVMIIDVIAGIITDADQRAAADVNGDGSVTITDCVAAIDLIAAQQIAGARRMTNTAAKSKLDGFINTALQKKMLMVDRMKSKKQNVK